MDAERWKRVDDLLQSVLQVSPDQQKEFLRQACAGDASLEDEVQSLLSSHEKLGEFLEQPALMVATQDVTVTLAPEAVDSLPGKTMAHYKVLRRLDQGGMGTVYEAEDLRIGRHVALKLLLEGLGSRGKALLRFRQEARAIGRAAVRAHECGGGGGGGGGGIVLLRFRKGGGFSPILNHPHICTLY